MNADLVKKALEKVLNPNILVNMVSRRVRQLTSGGGGTSRPLLADVGHLGWADIALLEIIEDKMSFDLPELIALTRPTAKNRRRPQQWARIKTEETGEGNGANDLSAQKRTGTYN
jgi:DNA-directed RNA polymerase subunit omega